MQQIRAFMTPKNRNRTADTCVYDPQKARLNVRGGAGCHLVYVCCGGILKEKLASAEVFIAERER